MSNKTEQNKKKQAYMKAAGYNVPQDGSWGTWQQKIYDKLTTRKRQYDVTLVGLFKGLKDIITGNTTYKVDPFKQRYIKKYNKDESSKNDNQVIKAIKGTWAPIAIGATVPTVIARPIAALAATTGSIVGSKIVDKASQLFTGNSFGANLGHTIGTSNDTAENLNPGAFIGGIYGIKRMLNSAYTNITPLGYNNDATSSISKNKEIFNMFKDFFIPKPINTKTPKWMKYVNKETVPDEYILFRNDAWRLATRQRPIEYIIDNKPQKLYIKTPDGTYNYNMDYVRHFNDMPYILVDRNNINLGFDRITSNAGFLNVKFKSYSPAYQKAKPYKHIVKYIGEPITVEDKFDLQPFHDINDTGRLLWKPFKNIANKYPNNPIVKYIKNFEVVKAMGGNPFVLKQSFKPGEINVYGKYFTK